jgi:hypothetical protein
MRRRSIAAVVFAGVVAVGPSLGSTGCGDPTGVGACEVIYTSSTSGDAPTTGLRIINELSTGLDAIVEGESIISAGAEMYPGDCGIWGLREAVYNVRLRPCTQEGGSSECVSYLSEEATRTVTVTRGSIATLRVTDTFFPGLASGSR